MEDKITVTVNGEEKTYLMSFALRNQLARRVGSYENPAAVFVDPDAQEAVILQIVHGRKYDPDNQSLFDVEISMNDGQRLVEWAGQHALDFFGKGLNAANEAGSMLEGLMPDQSTSGSQD